MPRSRVRLFVWAVLVVIALFAASFTACIPAYTFGDGTSDAAPISPVGDASIDATLDSSASSPDSSPDSPSPAEASIDAGQDSAPIVPFDGGITALAIADAGSKVSSTGFGYQTHLVYAQNGQRYWYFFVDDSTNQIASMSSPDFVTWSPGAAISLSADYTIADGNNFSVAYANIAGKDVVHLVVDADSGTTGYATLHIRATIGSGITASAPIALAQTSNGDPCQNDGPATTITPDGHVYDVTAWTNHSSTEGTNCDTDIYRAPGADLGASWSPGTFAYDGYYVSYPELAFSHDLLDLPDAGVVMLLYPDYDNDTTNNYFSMGWALSTSFDGGEPDAGAGVVETPSFELFTSFNAQASYDDWAACRLADTDVHVVRHVLTVAGNSLNAFDEVVYGGSTWTAPATQPPASTSLTNTGVALVSGTDGSKGMLLVTIGADYALNVAKWTSSGGWASAGKLAAGANPRQSLAGSGCGSVRPTVFWTETIGAANIVESADLSGFLP